MLNANLEVYYEKNNKYGSRRAFTRRARNAFRVLRELIDGEINVYNWGEYVADGSNDTVDIISKFEEEFNIKVNYTTYETNEELYNMLKSSNSNYDVVFPSDYMVEKLKNEKLLKKLDLAKIPNQKKIIDRFTNMDYDKGNNYSIPYSWNVTGLVYNKTMVKGKPESWNSLWDKSLSGSILMFNNRLTIL